MCLLRNHLGKELILGLSYRKTSDWVGSVQETAEESTGLDIGPSEKFKLKLEIRKGSALE